MRHMSILMANQQKRIEVLWNIWYSEGAGRTGFSFSVETQTLLAHGLRNPSLWILKTVLVRRFFLDILLSRDTVRHSSRSLSRLPFFFLPRIFLFCLWVK